MDASKVTLRPMTPSEYEAATRHREAAVVLELAKRMPEELARERVRRGTAQYLPDGLGTADHHLLSAVNESGEVVGTAWIGPDPREFGTATSAWLYDLHVFAAFRRHGYGSAILAAAERLVVAEGLTSLALNVLGDNEAAIALYRRNGYGVSAMYLHKNVQR